MGWGNRAARFFCKITSARKNPEIILSDADTGVSIVLAGEYGSLRITARGTPNKRVDRFQIEFQPWRKSETEEDSILLMTGVLDFDAYKKGESMTIRLDEEAVEMFRLMKAKQIMLQP